MERAKFIVAPKGIIINNGKVLLIKRVEKDDGGKSWEFVGGSMEYGENPIIALRREIREETGLIDIKIRDILYASMVGDKVTIITYLCETNSQDIILSNEHEDYCWVEKREMIQLLPEHIIRDLQEMDVFNKL